MNPGIKCGLESRLLEFTDYSAIHRYLLDCAAERTHQLEADEDRAMWPLSRRQDLVDLVLVEEPAVHQP